MATEITHGDGLWGAFSYHAQAQEAFWQGDYDRAARLFLLASREAQSASAAAVLLEKAADATLMSVQITGLPS